MDEFAEVLRKAQCGCHEALGRLIDLFIPFVKEHARRLMANDHFEGRSGSDLFQEVCMEAFMDFQRFQGATAEDFKAWLAAIMRHNLADWRRKRDREVAPDFSVDDPKVSAVVNDNLATSEPGPVEAAAKKELDRAVSAVVRRLPKHYRLVLSLHFNDRLTMEEIAEELGCSTEAARKYHVRALLQVREDPEVDALWPGKR